MSARTRRDEVAADDTAPAGPAPEPGGEDAAAPEPFDPWGIAGATMESVLQAVRRNRDALASNLDVTTAALMEERVAHEQTRRALAASEQARELDRAAWDAERAGSPGGDGAGK